VKLQRSLSYRNRREFAARITTSGILSIAFAIPALAQPDALPSWNGGQTKKSIVDFVHRVTGDGSPEFVPQGQRIATFDNDGTLWIEQPMYVQLRFLTDRVKALAPQHPEWKTTQPFKAVLENDYGTLGASGEKGLMQLLIATHSGMTSEEFTKIAADSGPRRVLARGSC